MGKAVFVEAELTAWDVRQATKFALIDGREPEEYEVCEAYDYLPGAVDAVLKDKRTLATILSHMDDGDSGGATHCVALRDRRLGECVLVCREADAFKMAYLPALKSSDARTEHDLALLLGVMAERGESDLFVRLPEGIEPGRHRLRDILAMLSECIDV